MTDLTDLFPDGIPCEPDCSCHGPRVVIPEPIVQRLAPWITHFAYCSGDPCICGLTEALGRELPSDRVPNGCGRCGHPFIEHERYGRCTTYHCRCRGWVAPRAGVAQQPERRATSPEVAGSTPASRSTYDIDQLQADGAQEAWGAYAGLSPLEQRYADGDR